jgi:hypothetical protein
LPKTSPVLYSVARFTRNLMQLAMFSELVVRTISTFTSELKDTAGQASPASRGTPGPECKGICETLY